MSKGRWVKSISILMMCLGLFLNVAGDEIENSPYSYLDPGKSGVIDHLIPGQTDHPKLSPKSESFAGHF